MKFIFSLAVLLGSADAFVPTSTTPSHHRHAVATPTSPTTFGKPNKAAPKSLQMESFLDNLPNPFSDNDESAVQPRPPSVPPPASSEPDILFSRAKAIVASDLGLRDPSILADDFTWVGPNVVSTGTLDRDEYLAAGQFFNLRKAFPDLDYRAHDFRIDPIDPLTVRLTARTVGTMRGELRLRSETLAPNGKRMVCPPESISMTFDSRTGKLVKLCSGFCMDRLVGNTGGLCGVMAAATVAGSPPSEWELYPPSVVVSRFFRRSVKQLKEPEQFFLAPFPESVMIQLAKGVLAAETGTKDPDLLSDEFTFSGPITGPLNKREFIDEFSSFELRQAFPDLNENYSNFRVDPYDPYRVWYDVKATGTRTGTLMGKEPDGSRYVGPPEAASMTFDDDGFCTRMTGGAVIDPTECNTGGLGGVFGILYAAGAAPSSISTRPLPQIISRIQKGILSPITGKKVDDFASIDTEENLSRTRPITPPSPTQPIVPREEETVEVRTPLPPKPPAAQAPKPPRKPTPPSPTLFIPRAPLTPPPQASVPKVEKKPSPPKTKPILSAEPADPVSDAFSSFFGKPAESAKSTETKKDTGAADKAKEARKKQAEEKRKATLAAAEAKMQQAEAKRAQALAAAEQKRKLLTEKKKETVAAKSKEAERVLSKAKPRATISLGFFGFGQKANKEEEEESQKVVNASAAPKGVPIMKDWRQNSDGSLTGLIFGSRVFGVGESITTSPILGKPADNTVVSTKTGSKYFLETKSVVGRKSLFGFGGAEKKKVEPNQPTKKTFSVQKDAAKQEAQSKKNAQLEAANRAKAEAAAKRKEELEAAKSERAEAAARNKEAQDAAKRAKAEAAARKNQEKNSMVEAQEAAKQAKAEAAARKKEEALSAQKAKVDAAASKKEAQEAAQRVKAEAATAAKLAKAEAAAKKKEKLEAAKKAKLEAAAKKKEKLEAAKRLKAEAQAKQKLASASAKQNTSNTRSSATISLGAPAKKSPGLFSFGKGEKKPPAGVPVISGWKKTPNGAIAGMISGSKAFKDGDKVTTSKLADGQTISSGNVVVTASGSKYFLK